MGTLTVGARGPAASLLDVARPNRNGRSRVLPRLRGLEWLDGFRGRAATEAGTAHIRLDLDRWARVHLDLGRRGSVETGEELRANASLPMNVRFAGPDDRRSLVADAWVGEPPMATGLRKAIDALGDAAVQPVRTGRRRSGHKDRFADAMGTLAERPDLDVVELPDQWELTQRLRGSRVALRVLPERGGLLLRRTLLKSVDGEAARWAVADLALRMNASARLVRFAITGQAMSVEARVHSRAIHPISLRETTMAMAVAAVHAGPLLRILADSPDIASRYTRAFRPTQGEGDR